MPNPVQYGTGRQNSSYDEESQSKYGEGFESASIRRAFILKVYSIIFCQLLFFTAIIAWCTYSIEVKEFMFEYLYRRHLMWVLIGIEIAVLIAVFCCSNVARNVPLNYILLAVFTFCSTLLTGLLVSFFPAEKVLIAAGLTVVVVLALTIFAMQTSIDFTVCGGALFVALILLIVVSIVGIFFPSKILYLIIAACGVLLFSIYLIYDTQLLMGGGKYEFDPEDYIIAAIAIYIDIINIFIYILELLGND